MQPQASARDVTQGERIEGKRVIGRAAQGEREVNSTRENINEEQQECVCPEDERDTIERKNPCLDGDECSL